MSRRVTSILPMGFSVFVEVLDLKLIEKSQKPVHLHQPYSEDVWTVPVFLRVPALCAEVSAAGVCDTRLRDSEHPDGGDLPAVTQRIVDDVIRGNQPGLLLPLLATGFAAFFLQELLDSLRIIFNNHFEQKVIFDLRPKTPNPTK